MASQSSQADATLRAALEEKDLLLAELNSCRLEHDQAVHQLHAYASHNEALQEKISNQERELKKQHGTLRQEIEDLSRLLTEVKLHNQASIRHALAQMRQLFHNSEERQNELRKRELLFQRIEGLERECQKWKNEAFGRGNKAVSICCQAWIDQALMRERAKDNWVVKNLQDEVRRLRAERSAEAASRVAECEEAMQGTESLLVKSLRAEIRLLKDWKGSNGGDMRYDSPWRA